MVKKKWWLVGRLSSSSFPLTTTTLLVVIIVRHDNPRYYFVFERMDNDLDFLIGWLRVVERGGHVLYYVVRGRGYERKKR